MTERDFRYASFDPGYDRARGWIQNRPIGGPAVLSLVLISGLVGALVEAALPQYVPVSSSMNQVRPLINKKMQVGVEVCAQIEVTSVKQNTRDGEEAYLKGKGFASRRDGFDVELQTQVLRVQNDAVITEVSHSVWIPSDIASMTTASDRISRRKRATAS